MIVNIANKLDDHITLSERRQAAVGPALGASGGRRAALAHRASSRRRGTAKGCETADHSLPYIVGRSLLNHEISNVSYTPESMNDSRVRASLSKLTVEEVPALTKMYPQKIPTRVTVTLDDGRVLAEQVDDVLGFGGRPMTRDDVEAKFCRNVKVVWPEQQTSAFLSYAWDLDRQSTVTGLFARMVVAAG